MHYAMRGQDHQPWAVHVDERHHDKFIGCVFTFAGGSTGQAAICGRGSPLVAVVERGLIAMVAIRDDQLFVAHLAPD